MNEQFWYFTAGYILAIAVGLCSLATSDYQSGKKIVEHGCAHYDSKTAAFTWNDGTP